MPARYLSRLTRHGYEDALFAAWRADPAFALNQPQAAGATVLLAGRDFGCGSSRDHAVWALLDYGFRVIIAPSFADIFRGNATRCGLLCITLPDAALRALIAAAPCRLEIDVRDNTATAPNLGLIERFSLSEHVQTRFLLGLDTLGLAVSQRDAIAAYEEGRPAYLPRLHPQGDARTKKP